MHPRAFQAAWADREWEEKDYGMSLYRVILAVSNDNLHFPSAC